MLGKDAERLGAARLSCGSAKRRIYMTDEKNDIRAQVREYYGKTLGSSDDLKTNACCCATERPPKYVLDVMPDIADEIVEKQLRMVHEIASLLGETASETKIAISDLKESVMMEDDNV